MRDERLGFNAICLRVGRSVLLFVARYAWASQEMQFFIERKKENIQAKIESGDYAPHSVWKTRGWPTDIIEAKCDDWVMHPQLDIKCYKVVSLTIRAEEKESTNALSVKKHFHLGSV